MKRRFTTNGKAGFSLLELLVTLGIISILAALVLPALSRSKQSAFRVKCLSNLKQMGLATQMYWDDNAGLCFRYRGAATNNGDIYWFGWLERGAEGERAFDARVGVLYSYLSGRGVGICPALNYNSAKFKLKARGAAFGYGYNLSLSVPVDAPPFSVSRITRTSATVLFGDAAQVNTFQAPASPENPMLEEFYYLSTNEPTAHFRHSSKLCAVFCDGHAEVERPVAGSIDGRLPAAEVGKLAPERLLP